MEKEEENIFILNLIESVQKNKCLYDKKDPFYFNKNVKARTWKEVGEKCSKSGADCKHRWKLLRERFCKEVKRMEAPSDSGMRFLDEWIFMQPMMFLKDYLAPRRTGDNGVEDETETVPDDCLSFEDSESLTPSETPSKKQKLTLDSLCIKFDETVQNIEKSLAPPTESTDELFMKTVVSLMKDLPVDAKDEFQAWVMQEIYRVRQRNRIYCNKTF